ncbi:MAG: exosortase B [Paucibacter sp.]|nr:exosortase B [Roseateles sp.]
MTSIQTFTDKWFGKGTDLFVLLALALGFAALYGPTYWDLSHTIWASDEQGHGPIILAVSIWLLFQRRHELAALPSNPSPALATMVFVIGLASYLLGRTQGIWILEVGSQILILAALLLYFKGLAGLKCAWFVLFFMIFMVPLPGALVAALTAPLKSMVSAVASGVLYWAGYPVGRSGVLLTVGPYQLLVADACAGLNSMFTLEALGMLYMNIMGYTSARRNIALALLIIPISFVSNVVRVMILVLVTYHFGDEAGQGFVHGAAGMVLFIVALSLMLVTDNLLNLFVKDRTRKSKAQSRSLA